jgi:hypothetical protein
MRMGCLALEGCALIWQLALAGRFGVISIVRFTFAPVGF